ncbi:MAG: hypothetical protein U0787_22095 [Polyangia bacterium]
MSDDHASLVKKLKDDILHVNDVVASAIESGERQQQYAAGPLIPPLVERYNQLLAQTAESEHHQLERTVGRMLTDLRRHASSLAKQVSGQRAEKAADAGQPFLLSRPQAVSGYREGPRAPRSKPKYAVGGEVEAWCGKCKELRTHDIVAVIDEQPKQVLCTFCKSRHGYRNFNPARRSGRRIRPPKTYRSHTSSRAGGKTTKRPKSVSSSSVSCSMQ